MAPPLPASDLHPQSVQHALPPGTISDDAFERRWQTWVARGAAHERLVYRRMRIALPGLGAIAALAVYWLVLAAPAGTP